MGDVDILVNNAGARDKAMNPDVRGYSLLSQLVGKNSMIGRGGRIINVAHDTGKDAVINFTQVLAGEWGQSGINVNAICPGLRRLGDDEDIKGATLLFASAAGQHITGQCLAVGGGVSAVEGA